MVSREFNKVVVFTGLSNCGKTTIISKTFTKRGYVVVSAAGMVHNIVKDAAAFLFEQDIDLFTKDIAYKFAMAYVKGEGNYSALRQGPEIQRRELLVHVAEKLLKKHFGAGIIGERVAYEVFQAFLNNQPVVYDCFFPEYGYFLEKLKYYYLEKCSSPFNLDIVKINILAPFQSDDKDGRELFRLPELTYTNYPRDTHKEAREIFSTWLDINGL